MNFLSTIPNFAFLLSLAVILLIGVGLGLFYKSRIGSGKLPAFLTQRRFLGINILLGIMFLALALCWLSLTPKIIYPSNPSLGTAVINTSTPVEIKINRPVNRSAIDYEIDPELPGKWTVRSGLFRKNSVLTFTPTSSALFGTRYTVSLSGIKSLLGRQKKDFLFSFETPPPPSITAISLQDGMAGVLPQQEYIVQTDPFEEKTALFEFALSPEKPLTVLKEGNKYAIRPSEPLDKGIGYSFKVFRSLYRVNYENGELKPLSEKEEIWTGNFTTIEAPGISSTLPTGSGVLADTNIEIKFKQDMDQESTEKAFSISPQVNGTFEWPDQRTLIFNPQTDLAKDTAYTVSIGRSAKVADGSEFESDVSFGFTTIGYAAVSKFSPGNGSSGVEISSSINIHFNQSVEHSSAESKVSVTPEISGSFSWNGNILIYKPVALLSYNTSYTINVASGIKSINGLDSISGFSSTFTTRQQSVALDVPAYRQAHMYSCMISAARSALAFRGINVSEAAIIAKVGYDSTPWSGTWSEGGAIWGDPDNGIVGDLDGKANNIGWGYGSHWIPIAAAINSFGRSTEIKTGWDVSGLAQSIAEGNPVIIWWVNGVWPTYEVDWKTPAGKTIKAVNGMHVQVVKGFSGTVDNPTSFTVTDSGYGYPGKTFDVGTFKAKWSWFNNSGIIVK